MKHGTPFQLSAFSFRRFGFFLDPAPRFPFHPAGPGAGRPGTFSGDQDTASGGGRQAIAAPGCPEKRGFFCQIRPPGPE
jgi:hypothetical protein